MTVQEKYEQLLAFTRVAAESTDQTIPENAWRSIALSLSRLAKEDLIKIGACPNPYCETCGKGEDHT